VPSGKDSDTEGASREESNGKEGTLSAEELENLAIERRDTARNKINQIGKIETNGGDVKYEDNRGPDVNEFFERHYEQLNELLFRLIILTALLVTALFLWRIGFLNRLLDILPIG